MRANGNGNPNVCAGNLLRMVRGEVPYDRVRGLDPRLVDSPMVPSMAAIEQDAEWLIGTYEPRVTFQGVNVEQSAMADGQLRITANIKETEE